MKIQELLEKEIPNLLGSPPSNIKIYHEIFNKIESEFYNFMFDGEKTGRKYVQALHDLHTDWGSIQEVIIKDLIPIEKEVTAEYVNDLKIGKIQPKKLPLIYLYDNKKFLVDGNHQVASKFLKGDTTVKANVVNITKVKKLLAL